MFDLVGQVVLLRKIENGCGLTKIGHGFQNFVRNSIVEPPLHKSCIRHWCNYTAARNRRGYNTE